MIIYCYYCGLPVIGPYIDIDEKTMHNGCNYAQRPTHPQGDRVAPPYCRVDGRRSSAQRHCFRRWAPRGLGVRRQHNQSL